MPYLYEKLDTLNSNCIRKAHIQTDEETGESQIAVTYKWEHVVIDHFGTGSYFMLDRNDERWRPNDIDFALLIEPPKVSTTFPLGLPVAHHHTPLQSLGFYETSLGYEGSHFLTFRSYVTQTHNLICFVDRKEFDLYKKATEYCTEHQVWVKAERIGHFQRIREEGLEKAMELEWI